MLNVVTVIGTRPEIIKLSETIKKLDKYTNHTLVHTGQNYDYELNEVFFKDLKVRKPNFFLDAAKNNASQTIAEIIKKTEILFRKIKPDAVLLYGDTNSCLSVISAKKNFIPIFHMEAGNRCFDQRVPEEVNRKIVDHLSDINLPLSERAREYLITEGIKPETIIKIGSPMKEVLNSNKKKIDRSKILKKYKIEKNKFFLVSLHREENVDSKKNLLTIFNSIDAIAKKYNMPILVSTHPRTKMRLSKLKHLNKIKGVSFCKPFGFNDYIKLQINAKCIISDSGTITEETSILNLPSIMIREMHERPEGMDEASVIMSGLEKTSVLNSIDLVIKQHSSRRKFKIISDYNVDNVSEKVVRIIYSYTNYVNKTVWHK